MKSLFEIYSEDALRTEAPNAGAAVRLADHNLIRANHAVLGLLSDIHELITAKDRTNAEEEIGDCFWFANLGFAAIEGVIPARAVDHFMSVLGSHRVERWGGSRELFEELLQHACNLADIVKGRIHYGKELFAIEGNTQKVGFERAFGTELELVVAILSYHCIHNLKASPHTIMVANIAKLRARFPEKYSDERANERDTDGERKAIAGVTGS